jgi:ATP-binding cassette subfamily F protein uup
MEAEIAKAATDYTKLNELMAQKEILEKTLEEKMDRWVYLNDLAEQIETAKNDK